MSLFLGNMGIIGEQLGTSTLLAASVGIKNVQRIFYLFYCAASLRPKG